MKSNQTAVADIHYDHSIWQNELTFYKVETNLFNKRLERLLKNGDDGFAKQIEHFQNQFSLQFQAVSKLRKKVSEHEKQIASAVQAKQSDDFLLDGQQMDAHKALQQEIDWFKQLYQALKMEYNNFSAKHL